MTEPCPASGWMRELIRRTALGSTMTLGCLCSLACGSNYDPELDVINYVDPEVKDFGESKPYEPTGPREVELGFYVEQLYEPLKQGEPLYVIAGLQGGRWTMPAVRVQGLETEANVRIDVVTDTGERVGEVNTRQRLVLANDGWLEVQALPVPIRHPAPREQEPIDDLYGQGATIHVDVIDGSKRRATQTLTVVLTQG